MAVVVVAVALFLILFICCWTTTMLLLLVVHANGRNHDDDVVAVVVGRPFRYWALSQCWRRRTKKKKNKGQYWHGDCKEANKRRWQQHRDCDGSSFPKTCCSTRLLDKPLPVLCHGDDDDDSMIPRRAQACDCVATWIRVDADCRR